MKKLSIGVLVFTILAAIWMIGYTHKPETTKKLNIKIEELEAQNAILRRLINIQNKDLEKCGFVHTVKYIKN